MRWLIVFIMLASSPVSAAEILSGADLLALCRTNVPACGDFIRTSLRKQGWADRTVFEQVKNSPRVFWWACPPVYEADELARLFVAYWRDRNLHGQSAASASAIAFSQTEIERRCRDTTRG